MTYNLPMGQGLIARSAATTPAGYLVMVDSAWPYINPQPTDITLIYIGGDTPHVWTDAEIAAAAVRTPLLWPCWVRSDPGAVNAGADAQACVDRLRVLGVPNGTAAILDLETAVNANYVQAFDATLFNAGYQTCKYGSQSTIWQNPQTSGGTFVAAPGVTAPITVGDCVATQFDFAGPYDLSWVGDTVNLWEAGDMAITNADAAKIAAAVGAFVVDTGTNATAAGVLRRTDRAFPAAEAALSQVLAALAQLDVKVGQQLDPAVVAADVVSQMAAQNFTATQIATQILAGLPSDLAHQVVAAMAAALATA